MPRIAYKERKFKSQTVTLIQIANEIIEEYAAQGFSLTVRQLYYQLVARDFVPNNLRSYKRVQGTIANAREAGLIDWNAIEDRTRELKKNTRWNSPRHILNQAYRTYLIDMWQNQKYRPEVWIEKDALTGVISGVCNELDVPYFSCRGYASASEVWKAGYHRIRDAIRVHGQTPVIIHMADHDPSGIDMTRDVWDRLELYSGYNVEVIRAALNMDQVEEHDPPPNPAKLSDSRAESYVVEFGYDSWELDALDPTTLANVIRTEVDRWRDMDKWGEKYDQWEKERAELKQYVDGASAG
jgi:hypothetical protein